MVVGRIGGPTRGHPRACVWCACGAVPAGNGQHGQASISEGAARRLAIAENCPALRLHSRSGNTGVENAQPRVRRRHWPELARAALPVQTDRGRDWHAAWRAVPDLPPFRPTEPYLGPMVEDSGGGRRGGGIRTPTCVHLSNRSPPRLGSRGWRGGSYGGSRDTRRQAGERTRPPNPTLRPHTPPPGWLAREQA